MKHKFLKRVVRLCLVMMVFITMSVALLAWHSGEQLSSTTVTALMGGWCGELLMALIKRKSDKDEEDTEDEPPPAEEEDEI